MVVVGVDFSAGSSGALETGRQLAAMAGGPLCPVHVVRAGRLPWRPAREETAWLKAQNLQVAELEVRRGEPWVELVKLAEERNATLVVAGTHGGSGFQPLRLGTTANNVALRCRTPVVLVPPKERTNRTFNESKHKEVP